MLKTFDRLKTLARLFQIARKCARVIEETQRPLECASALATAQNSECGARTLLLPNGSLQSL